jgi:hypothetical protein
MVGLGGCLHGRGCVVGHNRRPSVVLERTLTLLKHTIFLIFTFLFVFNYINMVWYIRVANLQTRDIGRFKDSS